MTKLRSPRRRVATARATNLASKCRQHYHFFASLAADNREGQK